jgi:glycerophosphoryl diester phosphodiesterase
MRFGFLPLVSILAACSPSGKGDTRIIGHGGLGAGQDLPMDCAESLSQALALGIDGVELDAQLTSDTVLVAFHPQMLEEWTPCDGKVNARRWADLQRCPITTHDTPRPIVRLDSLLGALAQQYPEAEFTFDCKLQAAGDWWSYLEAFTDAIVRIDSTAGLSGRLIVECQTIEFLQLLHRKAPQLPIYLYATDFEEGLKAALANGFAGLTLNNDRITATQAAQAHKAGLGVTLFGVGGWWGHRSALAKHPDRLQTDSPDAFVK